MVKIKVSKTNNRILLVSVLVLVLLAVLLVPKLADLTGRFSLGIDEPGLVSYYKFESNALDSSNNGNDGDDLVGTYTNGKIGKALLLDGVNDYVGIDTPEVLSSPSQLTVSAWIYPTSVAGGHSIVKGYEAGALYPLGIVDGKLYSWLGSGLELYSNDILSQPLNADKWYFITFTWDGIDAVQYIDGVEVNRLKSDEIENFKSRILIGVTKDSNSNSFNLFEGRIDEVRIYSKALTKKEIANMYATESGQTKILRDACLVSDGIYKDCYSFGLFGAQTGRNDKPRASCTLKVYSDNTYDVTCDDDKISSSSSCQGGNFLSKSIGDIGGSGGLTKVGVSEEFLCEDNVVAGRDDEGDDDSGKRIKVIKSGDVLTLWLSVINCWDCDNANCDNYGAGRISFKTLTCSVDISDLGITLLPPYQSPQLECTNDLGCTNLSKPICDTTVNKCVQCIRNSQCFPNEICENNVCILSACTVGSRTNLSYCDTDHTLKPFKLVGDLCTQNYECAKNLCSGGKCVDCISSSDCDSLRDCVNTNCVLKSCTEGSRMSGYFCNTSRSMREMKESGISCTRDYECTDNICDKRKCQSYAALQQTYCYLLRRLNETDHELC